MKRKILTAISSAILPLFPAICFAGNSFAVQAESTPSYWEGARASGAIVKGEDCPIVVEKETLHLNITSLPREGKLELSRYTSQAVAEYTFYNPTSDDVNMTLLFPFCVFPSYVQANTADKISTVLVNDLTTECSVRYSYASSEFNADQDLERVRDEKKTDYFYREDMPVTEYRVIATEEEAASGIANIQLSYNHKRTRVIFPAEGTRLTLSRGDMYAYTPLLGTEQKYSVFYVVGEPLTQAKLATREGDLEPIAPPMTFGEFALADWSEDSGVSEVDWYNAVVDLLNDRGALGGSVDCCILHTGNLLRWYEYEITVPANGRIVNKVKTPLYPTVEGNKNPRYEYSYLLSPAAKWADFKNIEIRIETPYLLLGGSLDFIKEERADGTGYTYTFSRASLPQGELTFVLTEREDGDSDFNIYDKSFLRPSNTWAFVTLTVLAGVAVAITIAMVVSLKRQHK